MATLNVGPKKLWMISKLSFCKWRTLSRYACPVGQIIPPQIGLSITQQFFHSRGTEEEDIKRLRNLKYMIGFCIFGTAFLIEWISKRKMLNDLKNKFDGCVRIPIDESLFKSKVSFYRYSGFIFPGDIILSGVFQELPKFNFREEDIIVASFPKAGTTWVQEIIYMLMQDFDRNDDSSEPQKLRFSYLEYSYPGIKSISKEEGRRLIKTHLPATFFSDNLKFSGTKLIYIMRNPKDTAVSYWRFMRFLSNVNFKGSFGDFLHLFLTDKVPFGPFYEHIRSYVNLQTTQDVLIVTYENLKENPVEVIKNIAEYLQISLSEEHALQVASATCFKPIRDNKCVDSKQRKSFGLANDAKFVRKGQVGEWKSFFTTDMLEDFENWKIRNDYKEQYKLKFE